MTTIILIKFIHYLAIVFSGGVFVGSGVIQSVYTKANQVPDLITGKVLKLLGYIRSHIPNCLVDIGNYTVN